jgi:hypothetical protein
MTLGEFTFCEVGGIRAEEGGRALSLPSFNSPKPVRLIDVERARITLFEDHLLARQNTLVVYDVLTRSLFIELL